MLYEPECFRAIDPSAPAFSVSEIGEDGERYAYPEPWSHPGFFEDYHDHVKAIREQFWDELRRFYPKTWTEQRGQTTSP